MKKYILFLALNLTVATGFAETAAETASEEAATSGESAGEDIRIFSDKHAEITEYRANGRVYMIMVTPKKGRPYYLVDADGDGEFDTRRNELSPNLKIPSWVIFSW